MSELRQQIFVAAGVVLLLGLLLWLVDRPWRLTGDAPQVLVYAPAGEISGFYSREKAIDLASQGDGTTTAWAERQRPLTQLSRATQNVITRADLAMRGLASEAAAGTAALTDGLVNTASLGGAALAPLGGELQESVSNVAAVTTRSVSRVMGASDAELRALLTPEGFDLARLEAALMGRNLNKADEWVLLPALRTAQSNPVVLEETLNELRDRLGL